MRLDSVEEADKFLMAVALHVLADHGAVEDIERGKQRRRAMPLVVVGQRGAAPLLHRQAGLRSVEGLDLGFLIHGQDNRMLRRIDVKPHNVVQFRREGWIVRELESPPTMGR